MFRLAILTCVFASWSCGNHSSPAPDSSAPIDFACGSGSGATSCDARTTYCSLEEENAGSAVFTDAECKPYPSCANGDECTCIGMLSEACASTNCDGTAATGVTFFCDMASP